MEDTVKDMKGTILFLWSYLKKEKKKLIEIIVFVVVSTLAGVVAPFLLSQVIDQAIPKQEMRLFYFFLGLLLSTYLIKSILTWITNRKMAYVSEQTLYVLRKELFEQLESLPLSYFDAHEKGDLMSRFTNDISVISDALTDTIVDLISSVITLVGTTIMMLWMNIPLSLSIMITVPFFFVLVFQIGKKANLYFTKQQNELGSLTSYAEEYFSGMKVIRSLGKEPEIKASFHAINHQLCTTSISAQTYGSLILPADAFITNIGNILLIAIGAILVLKGQTTVGSILAFLNYASMFRSPITNLASLFASMQSALAGAERVREVMEQPKEPMDGTKKMELSGRVIFQNVSFSYVEGKPILKNINLKVKPGEKIAIVGPTGSGKTTLVHLLNRFYEVTEGTILMDDHPITELSPSLLRKQIGVVLQDTYLFQDTVLNNIRYSRLRATREEVVEASKEAMAHAFIHRLPDGYETKVEEEGLNFSQGERQLISIARTVLSDPKILVLDEATSNIDTRTEELVQQGMVQLMQDRTCFIIAHRLSTIQNADRILVMKDGEIIEEGTHEQLLKKKGFYEQLYNSQFENEELV